MARLSHGTTLAVILALGRPGARGSYLHSARPSWLGVSSSRTHFGSYSHSGCLNWDSGCFHWELSVFIVVTLAQNTSQCSIPLPRAVVLRFGSTLLISTSNGFVYFCPAHVPRVHTCIGLTLRVHNALTVLASAYGITSVRVRDLLTRSSRLLTHGCGSKSLMCVQYSHVSTHKAFTTVTRVYGITSLWVHGMVFQSCWLSLTSAAQSLSHVYSITTFRHTKSSQQLPERTVSVRFGYTV